jgi:hypothetical protein
MQLYERDMVKDVSVDQCAGRRTVQVPGKQKDEESCVKAKTPVALAQVAP